MSSDIFAGQLCATHIGCRIQHPDLTTELGWVVFEVNHRETRSTVRIVCRGVGNPLTKNALANMQSLILTPDDYVTVAVR